MSWAVRACTTIVATGLMAASAWAAGEGSLEVHQSGSVYLSYGLFVILGMMAVLMVFKGTRTK